MRSGHPRARDDLVAVDQDVLRVHAHVGERRPLDPEELQNAFLRRREPGRLLVLDEIVGQQLPEAVDVAVVQQAVAPPRRRSVIHHPFPLSVVSGDSPGYRTGLQSLWASADRSSVPSDRVCALKWVGQKSVAGSAGGSGRYESEGSTYV